MKKLSLMLVVSLFALVSTFAQSSVKIDRKQKVNAAELKATLNPNDVSFLAVPENKVDGIIPSVGKQKIKRAASVKQLPRRDEAVTDTIQYFAVAQSFHSNYTFNYAGGDVYSYNIGMALNGTKVTLTNLFDMYNQSASSSLRSYDKPVDGVYDPDAKTITIPTTKEGIVCGDYCGYYDVLLLGGTVTQGGSFTPDNELVFDVTTDADGNIETITARKNMVIRYEYGTIRSYKSFTANIPRQGEATLKSFDESIDFGEGFINTETTKEITLFNEGGMDAEYAMELESDDDVFSTTAMTGVIPAHSSYTLPFSFKATKEGAYEGIATLTYDGGTEDKTFVIDLAASAKNYPDYSAVIKSGNFNVTTGIDFPFEMATLEDGTQVAQSGTHGKYGSSWLNLEFTVPEGVLATVKWKGVCNNSSYWNQNAGGYFVDTLDGAQASYTGANEDMSGSYEFAPGKHFIRYQYDGEAYTGLEANRLYVYDIEYSEKELAADSAVVVTPTVDLGNGVLAVGGTVTKTGVITLKNAGVNNLVVKKVTSDDAEFTADISGLHATATLDKISIPVTLETKTTGNKSATYTIETSAGTFTAIVKASVMQMPDFSSLVTEGAEYITDWEINTDAPFIIKDGKAVNKDAGDNSVSQTSWFKMNLAIPEGKLAYVSWEGRSYGRPEDNVNYTHYYSSYASVEMNHPMTNGTLGFYGHDVDAGSTAVEADDSWADYIACIPGNHYFKWGYTHNGDGTVPEGDYVEISNIKIHVIDFSAKGVELLTPEVEFEPTYFGPQRYKTATVTLRNTGSENLTVESISADAPFYGIDTKDVASFNKNIQVTLWFYPSESGDFSGDVILNTSAGVVSVKCHGVAKNAADDGYVYYGDFEDDAYGWGTVDRDHDGETWNLGSNLWGDRPEYCHSGSQCLTSISYSNDLGAVTPDNWAMSPIITIPADGAKLTYYVAAFHPDKWEEHYSMYVTPCDGDNFSVENVVDTTPVFSETLAEENGAKDGWSLRTFDLIEFAGKDVVISFRHHDCTGQYILRLDDVNVMTNSAYNAISTVKANVLGNTAQYFNLGGQKTNSLSHGINIVRTQDENGNVVVRKVLR